MADVAGTTGAQTPARGQIVVPAQDLAAVQTPDGELVPVDRLGPGLVERLEDDGVWVYWLGAGLHVRVSYEALHLPGTDAHLVSVYRCDSRGRCRLVRHRVAARVGFEHNWAVELRPPGVIRAVRDDGYVWTFRHNPVFNRVDAGWISPPEDEDAEAFTAAELAILNPRRSAE